MRDFINIGSVPYGEEPEFDVSHPVEDQKKECQRFIEKIREICGEEPEGARLAVKSFPHDFGTYCEVVCHYDDNYPDSEEYAFHVESNAPETWKQTEKALFRKEG